MERIDGHMSALLWFISRLLQGILSFGERQAFDIKLRFFTIEINPPLHATNGMLHDRFLFHCLKPRF